MAQVEDPEGFQVHAAALQAALALFLLVAMPYLRPALEAQPT